MATIAAAYGTLVADLPGPLVAEVTAAAAAELRVAPGVDVWLSVKATEVVAHPA